MEAHSGHVLDIDCIPVFGFHYEIAELGRVFHLPEDAYGTALAIGLQVACRHGHVPVADGIEHIVETHLGSHHLVDVHGNLHLLILGAPDVDLLDLVQVFDFILQVFRKLLELLDRIIPGQVHVHDGERFGQVQVEHIGFHLGPVEDGPVLARLFGIHFILHL